ncbi:MAG TPA: hypothetical protein VD834_16665, partial [Blastococcus sp.]|nr:hypothetical protein [Blastococcus sp.]
MSRAKHRLQMLSRSRVLVLAAAALMVAFLVVSVLWAQRGEQQAQTQTGVVAQERDATAAQAQSLAEQIKAACSAAALSGPVCEQAAAVAATPVPPVPGPQGPAGDPGP